MHGRGVNKLLWSLANTHCQLYQHPFSWPLVTMRGAHGANNRVISYESTQDNVQLFSHPAGCPLWENPAASVHFN